MTSLTQVFTALRKKNKEHYLLLVGCCFLSVLLITAYACMMRSPTILNVLPEGGDSRKQVMMVFILAVVGCGVFTTYAAGLFFRYKSRETGIFLALGASKKVLGTQMLKELAVIALCACALGALLGSPLAWLIWQVFRLAVVDTQQMVLSFDPQAYVYSLAFSLFVILMLLFLLLGYLRRTNIIDVIGAARQSEMIKAVPRWYGPLGIVLVVGGALLGYLTPTFCVRVLKWYAPEALTIIAYLPLFIGLYLLLLHTVANGWRQGQNRYKNIIGTSMMKFQGRQTVRNMLVITMLVAGAYFAAFYTPMLGTGSMMGYDARPVDYSFRYRSDQNMVSEGDIRALAEKHQVAITAYKTSPLAILGVDGSEQVETETSLGTTYTTEYRELLGSERFLSETAYNQLTGDSLDVQPGSVQFIGDDEGSASDAAKAPMNLVTNPLTGAVLSVTPTEMPLANTMLFDYRVLDDADYAAITQGLTPRWLEYQVFFNVAACDASYNFAKALFNTIVDRSGPEVAVSEYWDPVGQLLSDQTGEPYWADPEVQAAKGEEVLDYNQRDSSAFRMYWQYMPQFRVLDKADFVKTTAVFIMLFVFIAIVCFAAVIVIATTRCLTIALTNVQVYEDLKRLGANNRYLLKTVKAQIAKVFFTPILTGTLIIYAFYMMIMFFNDGGHFSTGEIAGLLNCLILIGAVSLCLYLVYRFTLGKVCGLLGIELRAKPN